jgi:tetratricopeptide (TPR) repeat protein
MWILFAPAVPAQTGSPPPAALSPPPAEMSEEARRAQPMVEEGFFQARVGNHARAIDAFRQALSIDARSRRAMFGLGTSHIAIEQYADATNVLLRAIHMDRSDYFALNNLAWLHATARDIRFRDGRRSVALAREALMIAPMDYHVWSTLAEGYYISGDYAKAQRAAEEARRVAKAAGLPEAGVQEYELQVQRCRAAAEAMDILE